MNFENLFNGTVHETAFRRWLQWIQRYWVEIPENAAEIMIYAQQKPWGGKPGAGGGYTYNEYFTRAARGENLPPLSHVPIFDSATYEDVYAPGIWSPLSAPARVSSVPLTKPIPSEIPMATDFLTAATAAMPKIDWDPVPSDDMLPSDCDWARLLGEQQCHRDRIARAINGLPEPRGYGLAKTEAEARESHQVWLGPRPLTR